MKSNCCSAPMEVSCADEGTQHYICVSCKNACDPKQTTTNNTMPDDRKQFESWITSPPFEASIERHPNDETKAAWPDQYIDYHVQLAWEAWQARTDLLEQRAKVAAENLIGNFSIFTNSNCSKEVLPEQLAAIILAALKGETK